MGIGGRQGRLPIVLVAVAALAGVSGAWLGSRDGGYAPRAVTARFVLGTGGPAGFVDSPPVADGSGGVWAATRVATAFGTDRKAGALVHLRRDGSSQTLSLPTTNSYPQDPVVAADGALWFVYSQGDGSEPTVDTGPDLRDQVDSLARRGADGTITRFPIPSPARASVRFTVAGADGSVWFDAYTQHGDFYGRFWPDGHSAVYTVPDALPYVSMLLPDKDGTVWIASIGQAAELLRVSPETATVLARTAIPGATSFDAIAGPVPAPGSGVWIETGDRGAARVGPSGAVTAMVPGDKGLAQEFAGDGVGGIWILRPYAARRDIPAREALLRHVGADGSVTDYHPSLSSADSYFRFVTVATDGAVWLTAGPTVERLG